MSIREKFEKMLADNGMWPEQAKQVMEIAMPILDEMGGGYKMTWYRPSEEYADVLYDIMFLSLKKIALDWIEENQPLAWFKPMFM